MGLAAADGTAQLRGEATHVTHHLGPQHLLRCAERPLATPTWRGAAPRLVAVRGERVSHRTAHVLLRDLVRVGVGVGVRVRVGVRVMVSEGHPVPVPCARCAAALLGGGAGGISRSWRSRLLISHLARVRV